MNLLTLRRVRFRGAFLVSALIAGLSLTGGIAPPAYAAAGTLSGTVTEAGSGAQLAGVSVQAFCWQVAGSTQGQVCGQTQTASDGNYSLTLTSGTYKILFEHFPAHARQYYGGGTELSSADSLQVSVPASGSVTGIDAALVPLRSVTGTVTGNVGPLDGINVTAYRQPADQPWTSVQGVVTAPDGSYALHLPDGTYRIGFADSTGPYRTVFFDAADTVDHATDVVVAGADVAGIDADMVRNHPITGTVTVDGVNMPGVTVTAWQQVPDGSGSMVWDGVKVATTGADGSYALYLPDGTYRVEFKTYQARFPAEWYDGFSTLDAATDVIVAGAEVPNIDATILSGPTDSGPAITGTATVAGTNAGAEFIEVTAYRFSPSASAWVFAKSTPTAVDGTYTLYLPERTYRVGFRDPSGRYRPVFFNGADTVDAADDVVLPTAGVANIDAQLVANHAITGTITADLLPGQPPGVPEAVVTAWRWNAGSADWERVQDTLSDPVGAYALYVPDGTYRVGFSGFSSLYQHPLYYDGVDNLGDASDVTVAGADAPNINAHLVATSDEVPPRWRPATTLSDGGQDSWAPQIAVGENGAALAVWYRRDGTNSRVQAAVGAADGSWSPPVNLSKVGDDATDPQVALGPKGTAVAVWRRWDGAHYQVQATSRATDGSWSVPVSLSVPGGDSWDPQLDMNATGTAVVVWRQSDGSRSQVEAATRNPAGHWSAAVALSRDGGDAWDPQVAVGKDGTAVAAWSRSDGAHYRVQVMSLSAKGTWSSPVALSQAGEDAWDPEVDVGSRGRAAVAWRRSDGNTDRIQVASRPDGGAWSGPDSVSAAGRAAYDPDVTVHPDGTVTAVWTRWDGTNDRVQAASWSPGGAWPAPTGLSLGGIDAQHPHVAAGPDGRATAVWVQSGGFSDGVSAAIRTPNGSWSVSSQLTSGGARAPAVAATGSDSTVGAVWEWRDGADDRVQGVVRVDATGAHCRNEYGVDLNAMLDVPEQLVTNVCTTVTTHSRWRPLASWVMNTAYDAVPPGYVPARATPLLDLVSKLQIVRVVIDRGTKQQRTVDFSPTDALRIDRTLADYAPGAPEYPMAFTLPSMAALRAGQHTVLVIWRLSAQHCDGFTDDVATSCLPSGDTAMASQQFTVVNP